MAGSFRERSPGRWELRAFIGKDPVTGNPIQVTRTYTAERRERGAGKREAEKQLAALVAGAERGEYGGTRSTFGSLLDEWVAHVERMGRSPRTVWEYRRKIDRSIRPALGAKRLDKLTAFDLDKHYARQLATGLSPTTVLMEHRMISTALKQGRKWGWVDRNVAEDATAPSARRPTMKVPSPEQVRHLIVEATRPEAKNPELATIILVAAITGMRRGELCGLQWRDVEWDASAIVVARSVWQTPDGIGVKPPKTHQTRRLLLGPQAMEVLKGRHERATEGATLAGVALSPDSYIFSADPDGSRPMIPDTLTQAFERLCRRVEQPALERLRRTNPKAKRADLPPEDQWSFRLHDLRHYTATQLFADGMNPKTVADRLGHADASVTLRVYTANTNAQAQAAADLLDAGLGVGALPL